MFLSFLRKKLGDGKGKQKDLEEPKDNEEVRDMVFGKDVLIFVYIQVWLFMIGPRISKVFFFRFTQNNKRSRKT